MHSIKHRSYPDDDYCYLDNELDCSIKFASGSQSASAITRNYLHLSFFILLLDHQHSILVMFCEVNAFYMYGDWDQENVQEPNNWPIYLDYCCNFSPWGINCICNSISAYVYQKLRNCNFRSIFNLAHLQESDSHDYAELWTCCEQVKSIDYLYQSYLPACPGKISLDRLWFINFRLSIYYRIRTKGDKGVYYDSSHKNSKHDSSEFIMGGCVEKNLNNKIMDRITHCERSC